VTRAAARRFIRNFLETRESMHSAQTTTAWVILEYLRVKGLANHLAVQATPHFVHLRLLDTVLEPAAGTLSTGSASQTWPAPLAKWREAVYCG
jgi:hypothetical protein